MKKALIKDSLTEIKKSFKRFFSILLMSLLGVGFFCGLKAASPDMKLTMDKFFDDNNFYDLQIVSTLGLTDEDYDAISKIDGVKEVFKTFSTDVKLIEDSKEYILNATAYQEGINGITVKEGRLPENENECVVEASLLTGLDKKIGDTIKIEEELGEDETSSFKTTDLTIVGSISSSLYISRERGTTTLGSGKINYYIYVDKSNISADYYTSLFIHIDGAKELSATSKEYENLVEEVKDNIEEIVDSQKMVRYDSLIGEANRKLDDAQNELDTQKSDAEKKIQDAENEIENNENKLNESQNTLNSNKSKANTEFANAKQEIQNAKDNLKQSEDELASKKQEAEKSFEEAENKKSELNSQLESLNSPIAQIESSISEISKNVTENGKYMTDEQLATANGQISSLQSQLVELKTNKAMLESGIKQIDDEVSKGKAEIEEAEKKISDGYSQIDENEKTLNQKIKSTNKQLEDAQAEIDSGKTKIEEAKVTLEENKQEFNEKIADAESKLIDARDKVAKIEKPEWYIFDRENNSGYEGYENDSDNIAKIATVFPIVFFVVAILISLTSMTRMVEEQRGLIGTLKALGYTNSEISLKYILYSSLATVIGGVIGMNIGFNFLPRVIISLYGMMYPYVNTIVIEFNWFYAVIGLALIFVCIIGATMYAVYKELKCTPATLMRPKAPRAGKRVILERIPFIWNKLKFTQKVTFRNMFRYKKRFIMTIVGISGCTALILTGFGIKDSVSNIMHFQYGNVYQYDAMVTLKSSLTENDISSLLTNLKEKEEISEAIPTYITSEKIKANDTEKDAQIIVVENNSEFDEVIHLNDVKTGERLALTDNSIFITDKAAQLLKIKAGDTITVEDADHNEYNLKVGGVVEQYLEHFIYISKDLYESTFGKEYDPNVVYINYSDVDFDEDEFLSQILKDSKISTAMGNTKTIESVDDMLTALNSVVYILIVSAGLLAFVVLYNLANINISERIRELATIKVLGFYDKEVFDYVNREIVFLTIIGIILGLIFGKVLNTFIISTCEIEKLRFKRIVMEQSYVYSALITAVFSIIVNFATYFVLKKIDMIESLKSVE
jgi:putative ABC transport system permease protein